MKSTFFYLLLLVLLLGACMEGGQNMKKESEKEWVKNLTDHEKNILLEKGTEPAFSGDLLDEKRKGIYVAAGSGIPLFSSEDKFDSGSGWPSFTKVLEEGNIILKEDYSLGMKRIEVLSKEGEHLGHVFDDGPAPTGKRFCINSAALKFIPEEEIAVRSEQNSQTDAQNTNSQVAIFGAGCFWGVEHLFKQLDGVLETAVGYSGGTLNSPGYYDVSTGKTGHAEVVKITFDPKVISYKELVDYFWRVHDPTQVNRQGPDIGTQYRSVIFYFSEEQKIIANESKNEFEAKKVFDKPVATQIVPAQKFYYAEEYHQDYADKNPNYVCHVLRED